MIIAIGIVILLIAIAILWVRDEKFGRNVINRFNLSYAIMDNIIGEKTFSRSLKEKKGNLYDNGRIQVWSLF